MTDFIEGLEQDLVAAAERQAGAGEARAYAFATDPAPGRPGGDARTPRRPAGRAVGARRLAWSVRAVAVAVAVFLSTAAVAAATLYTLRGAVIPAPAGVDVPREQTPVPSSAHVSELRVPDPTAGVPPWTVRVARSDTGYVCSTVGQVRDGRFGLVGLDRRFRELAPGLANSCGQEQRAGLTLVGARVLAGKRPRDVRTIVNGVGGDGLRRVEIETSAGRSSARVGAGGTFVAVLAGYPEDLGLRVSFGFSDGRRQVETFGRDPRIVPDPEGGGAWKADSMQIAQAVTSRTMTPSRRPTSCTSVTSARSAPAAPRSPSACGRLSVVGTGTKIEFRGVFLAVRRFSSDPASTRRLGGSRIGFAGDWHGRPARTVVWGMVGNEVRSVTTVDPAGRVRPVRILPGGALAGVFPASVDPALLRVRIRTDDGRTRTVRGQTGLRGWSSSAAATTRNGG